MPGPQTLHLQPHEQQRSTGGSPLKSAAAAVLRRAGRLMTAGEICRLSLEWGLLTCTGRLPEASLASALCGDIKRHGRSSQFVRPQEGMFGLQEWAGQGHTVPGTNHNPNGASSSCGVASISTAGMVAASACGSVSIAVQPSAVAPAKLSGQSMVSQAAKRANPEPPAASKATGRGPGRPKKARRSTEEEEEDWSDSASLGLSDPEQLDGSEDEGRLEPRQYSLRKGQVGRLQEAVETATAAAAAATAAAAAAGLSTAWNAPCLAGGQSTAAAPAALPAPEPFSLPNLRPASAEVSRGQHSRRPSSGGGGASLLSPPLHLVLQSPPARVPVAGSGGSGQRGSLFSPYSGAPGLRSPLEAAPWLSNTPATLHSLLSPYGLASLGSNARQQQQQQQQAASHAQRPNSCGSMLHAQRPNSCGSMLHAQASAALRGSAVSTTAAIAPAAPGTAGSVLMVPLREGAMLNGAASVAVQRLELPPIPPLNPRSQQGFSILPLAVGQAAQGEAGGLAAGKQPGPVSVLVDATGWAPLSGEAVALGRFEIVPAPAAGLAGSATSAAAASIAQRVREVQAKVQQVEAKWGPWSLKTGQAYFLMAHACMHPQAAPLFQAEAEAALQRSQEILQHNSMSLAAGQEDEYHRLLKGIRAAASGGRQSGGPAGVGRAM